MTRISLIIDCDPGVDDAVALLLAFASPELELLGVTTVAGNVGPLLTARNARLIRQIAGREDVPVHAGCTRPMVRRPVEAGEFHGASGLGDMDVFEPAAPLADGHAVDFIIETVMNRPERSVSLAMIGPLTNLAMALVREPRLAQRIGKVVIMGGARSEGGNITASSEYNIHADPHAAHVVFESGCNIVAMGLDVTHQVRATPARTAALKAIDTLAGRTAAAMMVFSNRVEAELADNEAAPLHDPCTVAYLLKPELFTLRPACLRVETASPLTLGHTAVEFRLNEALRANCLWATAADADGIFALLNERLAKA